MSKIVSLARRINQRQRFIEAAIKIASHFIHTRGTQLSYEKHSCHTTVEAELKDFEGFSFHSYGAYSMYGGEELQIWYCGIQVLDVQWWDIKECEVRVFSEGTEWQGKLIKLMKDEDKIIARIKRIHERALAKKKKETNQLSLIDKLDKEVERLRL